MNASDVKEALAKKWPDDQYIRIEEAPQDAARQGRKIDLLVVSLWQSRGFELDAVEIKVSMSDWKRELDNAAKADWWWRHAHRFWVAVPTAIAEKVRAELPSTWGLLACSPEGVAVVVKAPKHTPEPFTWPSCIGLIRAAVDAGPGALMRARDEGREVGFKEGVRAGQAQTGAFGVQGQLEALQRKVATFEQAAGVSIESGWRGGDIGRVVAAVRAWEHDPEWALTDLERMGEKVKRAGVDLAAMAVKVREAFKAPGTEGAA
jgi:hypothetical protein